MPLTVKKALKKIENLHLSATPFMFFFAGVIAGLGHLATENPNAKGWDLLLDPNFLKRAGVVTLLANIGFTVSGTALDVYMQRFKASLKHQLQAAGIEEKDMTAEHLAAFARKYPKTIIYDAVTGYLGGTATFFLFPYILVILGQIGKETLIKQFDFSEAQAQLVTNALTGFVVTGAFEVFSRVKLPIKQWLQFVPGIFGMTLGTSIAELVIHAHPDMTPAMQNFVRIILPATIGALSTAPATAISILSEDIKFTAKLCASSLSNLFRRRPHANDYQLMSVNPKESAEALLEDNKEMLSDPFADKQPSNDLFDIDDGAEEATRSGFCQKLASCFRFGR